MNRSDVVSRVALFLALTVLPTAATRAEPRPAWDYETFREGYDLSEGVYEGIARLSVDKPVVRLGEEYRATITFENTSEQAYDVFNPFLVDEPRDSAVLALYDSKKQFVGNLLLPSFVGKVRLGGIGFNHWCRIEAGEKRSVSVDRIAGVVGGTQYIEPTRRGLPPGKYYIQAVYLDRFASVCPWYQPANPCGPDDGREGDNGDLPRPPEAVRELQRHGRDKIERALAEWRETYDGSELFRSNIVELTILPRPIEAAKP